MNEIERALEEGAKRSRDASSLRPPHASGLRPFVLKHRWIVLAVLMFLLIDILVLSGFGSTTGGW